MKTSERISSESITLKNWKKTSEIMQTYATNLWSESKRSGNISTQMGKSTTVNTNLETSPTSAFTKKGYSK